METLEPHTQLVGMQNFVAALQNSLAVPQKVKQSFHMTEQFQSYIYPRELKTCSHKNLYRNVHRRVIHNSQKVDTGTSLVAQWLRIRLPVQGTRVRALVWEDPTCCRATKPACHNYWACALEPASHSYWTRVPRARAPQQEKPPQ